MYSEMHCSVQLIYTIEKANTLLVAIICYKIRRIFCYMVLNFLKWGFLHLTTSMYFQNKEGTYLRRHFLLRGQHLH